MLEEIDYSEEAKYDLFESIQREKKESLNCFLINHAPPFNFVKNQLNKKGINITQKDYEKACKELNIKFSS